MLKDILREKPDSVPDFIINWFRTKGKDIQKLRKSNDFTKVNDFSSEDENDKVNMDGIIDDDELLKI